MNLARIANVVIVVAAVVLTVVFLADDTPAEWLVRLAYAGAIVAGFGVALYALADVIGDRTPRPRS